MSIENGNAGAAERSRRKRSDVGASLRWQRAGNGWRLFDGRRRFGDIVPDERYLNMWRPVLSGGKLGDLANITWAKHSVFEAAVRELEWEGRRGRATDPSKCPENAGVFRARRPPNGSGDAAATPVAAGSVSRASRAAS